MDENVLKLLVVDDDFTQIQRIKTYIKHIDYPPISCITAKSAEEAISVVEENKIDLVLSDYIMPGKNGLELLKTVKEINPLIGVVIMTAFENAKEAVEVLQNGGDDYLIKPTNKDDIEHLFIRYFEKNCLFNENQSVIKEIDKQFDKMPLVYESKEIKEVLNIVARTSETDATVLITGESGTGKDLISGLIHGISGRKDKALVTVNIAALPESLMESELFGHKKGSFTGADSDREGRFEEADGGTLFIDEVGEIPPSIQVKLLRAIQFGKIQRIGENRERELNVRIIAATNRNLEEMIKEKLFRNDLYWRLNVVRINIPPLRMRKIDISVLTNSFIKKFSSKNNKQIEGISGDARDTLMKHTFPGNVRELENIIERSVIMARGNIITSRDLPPLFNDDETQANFTGTEENYETAMNEYESDFLLNAIEKSGGNQSKAARLIGISERRLRSRLSILGIKNSEDK
jgi:DNA-binding NtrC family response regulator